MTLVEWTRLEGGQVEAVVAMMVNRERPNPVRITPSRGDGGVDILDRKAGPGGSDLVYQVKRYTDKLTAKQKKDIEDSLVTLMKDERWAELNVVEWHLVTPWNPSPEAENCLQDLGREHGVTPIWHGFGSRRATGSELLPDGTKTSGKQSTPRPAFSRRWRFYRSTRPRSSWSRTSLTVPASR
jgi:hypothetical protein